MPVMTKTPQGDDIVILSRAEYDALTVDRRDEDALRCCPKAELHCLPVSMGSRRIARSWPEFASRGCCGPEGSEARLLCTRPLSCLHISHGDKIVQI